MKKIYKISAILLFCSSALMAQKATITNVVITPANITVTYNLTTATPVDLTLCYSLDGKCTWDDAIAVTGHITCQTAGNGKTIVWNNVADFKQYGIFYFKIKTEPCVFTCESFFAPAVPVLSSQYVDIVVEGVVNADGVFVGSDAPTATKTLRFMTYNLGANPNLTPKQQLASFPIAPDDLRVYGGFYQWGRKDPRHTFRCAPDPNITLDPRFTPTLIPTSGTAPNIFINPADDNGRFVSGINAGPANSYQWYPRYDPCSFWGNGGGLLSQTNTTYSGVQNSQNPCPPGYRVPTHHEWALLAQEGGNAANSSGDGFLSTEVTLTGSGLYWVNVVNGKVSSAFTEYNVVSDALCGYAIYEKTAWENAYPSPPFTNLDLTLPTAPEPLLFLPAAGCRHYYEGNVIYVGYSGNYWSSTVDSYGSCTLGFYGTSVSSGSITIRALGGSVRCIGE